MEYHLRTKLNGNIAMTSCFHENSFLQRDRSLYKFIWVRHLPMLLKSLKELIFLGSDMVHSYLNNVKLLLANHTFCGMPIQISLH